MKTERELKLEKELSHFNPADLDKPMIDIDEFDAVVLSDLVEEAGYGSMPRSYITANGGAYGWTRTLRDTITDLVTSIYRLDGKVYDSISDMESAAMD